MNTTLQQNVTLVDVRIACALHAALSSADVKENDLTSLMWKRCDALYEIVFSTDWMVYDAFVDPDSMEVLGLDWAPAEIA